MIEKNRFDDALKVVGLLYGDEARKKLQEEINELKAKLLGKMDRMERLSTVGMRKFDWGSVGQFSLKHPWIDMVGISEGEWIRVGSRWCPRFWYAYGSPVHVSLPWHTVVLQISPLGDASLSPKNPYNVMLDETCPDDSLTFRALKRTADALWGGKVYPDCSKDDVLDIDVHPHANVYFDSAEDAVAPVSEDVANSSICFGNNPLKERMTEMGTPADFLMQVARAAKWIEDINAFDTWAPHGNRYLSDVLEGIRKPQKEVRELCKKVLACIHFGKWAMAGSLAADMLRKYSARYVEKGDSADDPSVVHHAAVLDALHDLEKLGSAPAFSGYDVGYLTRNRWGKCVRYACSVLAACSLVDCGLASGVRSDSLRKGLALDVVASPTAASTFSSNLCRYVEKMWDDPSLCGSFTPKTDDDLVGWAVGVVRDVAGRMYETVRVMSWRMDSGRGDDDLSEAEMERQISYDEYAELASVEDGPRETEGGDSNG